MLLYVVRCSDEGAKQMAYEDKEMEQTQAEELLTIDEAAKFLDTSKSTLYRLLGQGDIKGTKVGKQWRFRKPDLTAYLERKPEDVSIDAPGRVELDMFMASIGYPITADTT